jgi:RNA polymerase primary sigma factor
MATKTTERESDEAVEDKKPQSDGPLLDLTDQAVKRMIKLAKKRGFVTYEELNDVLPSEEFTSDQIEDVYAQLSEMGINVVESDDNDDTPADTPASAEADAEEEVEGESPEPVRTAMPVKMEQNLTASERTDDPVRMYLREMGSVELLSREGEIAIAKRIEAGREAMIAGLCESPLTFQAIIIWRDELNEGKVLLREIIDLEATYAGPDGKGAPKVEGADGFDEPDVVRTVNEDGEEVIAPPPDLDEDDLENNVSLSAMEAELKPKVLETFDAIADNYKKLRRLQDQDIEHRLDTRQPR